MAFGDVFVQVVVPPQPQGAGHTHEEYMKRVKERLQQHLQKYSMTNVRTSWMGRADVPENPAQNAAYVKNLLVDTSIDTAYVVLTPEASDDTVYCIVSTSEFYCYSKLTGEWTGTAGDDPFVVTVPLDNGKQASVRLEFVVRWLQPLEGAPTVTVVTRGASGSPATS